MPLCTANEDGNRWYDDDHIHVHCTSDADIDNEKLCVCPDKESGLFQSRQLLHQLHCHLDLSQTIACGTQCTYQIIPHTRHEPKGSP